MNHTSTLSARSSRTLAMPSAARSNRTLRSLVGLGLVAVAGGLPGCGAEATDAEPAAPSEQVGAASQALSPTCVTLRRGGPGGIADTRLRQDTPTTPYGSVVTVVTGNQNTNRVVLLGFDLSPIPAGAVITSADVTLNELLNQGPSTVSVHAVTAAWNEATATWNSFDNAYAETESTSFSNGGGGHQGPISFSIAPLAQGWVNGAANYGVALLAPTDTTWSSSEATTAALRPTLAVCYTPPSGSAIAIAGGDEHSLVLKLDGTVWAMGWNHYGQVGDGTTTDRALPAQISGLSGVTAVSAGLNHSLALKADGTVWTVGASNYQLDNWSYNDPFAPGQIHGLSGITAVSAGWFHSLALKSDGTVWALGYGGYGALGDGANGDEYTPQVSGLSGITAVSAGSYHSLALKSDGTVWAFGHNGFGELGDGTAIDRNVPVQVSGLSSITAVSAGGYSSFALKSDGTVWAVGYNAYGQLGDGTTTDRYTPVQVNGLSAITAVSAGGGRLLALKSDGTIWAVGCNFSGQLGDGTTTERHAPVQVSGLSGVSAVSAGGEHLLALKRDGTVWAAGANYYGQLGDGTTTNQSTRVLSLLP